MPDETGTEATRSDTPGVDDSLFGDAADEKPAAVADEQDSAEESEQDGQVPSDAGEPEAEETPEQQQGSETEGEQAGVGEDAPANELKVVVVIKGGRATIGVQQPSSDPHVETFGEVDLARVTEKVSAVAVRAKERWEEMPKHPAYERPAPPTGRRRGTAQDEQQMPRLL